MRRLFCCLVLALACVIGMVRPASATSMTISATTLTNWQFTAVGSTVYLEITVDQAFTATDLITYQPWQPNAGPTGGGWRRRIPCTVTSSTNGSGEVIKELNIPGVIGLQSTVDAPIGTKNAKYTAYFTDAQGRYLAPYEGFTSFRVPSTFATGTTGTWSDVRSYNSGPSQIYYDLTYFSQTETLRLINEAVANNGLTSINSLMGPALTIAGSSNIQITSGGSTITASITGLIPIANGGTNAATAANARTNLGAAASGANSDITSLSALSTPLSGAQGGTGIASYTTGDLLYASGASTLSKLNAVGSGQVLTSAGVGVAPVWTASPTLTNVTATSVTVSGLTSGRVTFAGAAGLLSDDSNLLYNSATDRLSLGTTDSTNTLNLPNAGYVSGRGSVAAAQVKIAAIADAARFNGAATTDTVDAITLGNGVPIVHSITDAGAAALTPLGVDYQDRTNGQRILNATTGAFNDSTSSNIFLSSTYVTSIGTAPVVGNFSEAIALGTGSSVWAFNNVAYTNVNAGAASSHVMESDLGALGTSASQEAYGIVLASRAGGSTPAGTIKSFLQFQRQTGAPAASQAVNGIHFNTGSGQIVTNAAILANGLVANYLIDGSGSTLSAGINFYGATFGDAAIVLPNTNGGIYAQDTGGTERSILTLAPSNFVQLGDAAATAGTRLYSGTSVPTISMPIGTSGYAGNVGFNQSTPIAQQHVTAINKRTISGSVNFSTATPTVVSKNTSTNFLADLAPGNTVELSWYPGHYYIVQSVATDNLSFTLTSSAVAAGNFTGGTVNSDYAPLLIEGYSGEDWLALNNQHVLRLYGDSQFGDERGLLAMVARANTNQKLLFGIDSATGYGYVSSLESGVGWKPLYLQAGAAGSAVGGVVIGVATPSSLGAMLKVQGAQTNPGANNTGSEFNNLSTSNAYFQKVSASYQGVNTWIGPNIGIFTLTTGGVDASSEDLTNVPIAAFGGKSFFGPHSSQVVTPAPPVNLFSAIVDIYGVPTDDMTKGATHFASTSTSVNVAGTNTTWNTTGAADRVRPGAAVQFASESTIVYQVATVASDVALTLTGPTGGTAGNTQMRADPFLLRVRNSFGTERFRVESSGFTKVTGPFVQNQGATIATVAGALTTPLADGNTFIMTGNLSITSILTDSSEAGKVIYLIFTGTGGLTDGSNLKLKGNFAGDGAGDAFDSITLVSDGTEWIELGRSVN